MLAVAEAMSASMHWNFLAQYSILKEMLADLRSIATTSCKQTAGASTEPMEEKEGKGVEKEEVEHGQSGGSANVLLEKEKKEEVKEDEEKPAWIRKLEEFVEGLWWQEEEEEANAGSTVETEGPTFQRSVGAEAPDHQEVQSGGVDEQLEDQVEEHVHDAAAHEEAEKVEETGGGGQAPAAVQEGQVGNQCYHLTSHCNLHQEEVEGEQVDPQVVERLHHAYRLLQVSPCYASEPDHCHCHMV